MSDDGYRITHGVTVHNPPVAKEDIPEGHGACDALFIVSMKAREDGTSDMGFDSVNGFTGGNIPWDDVFKIWCKLSSHLKENLPLGSGRQEICSYVAGVIDKSYQQAREAVADADKASSDEPARESN